MIPVPGGVKVWLATGHTDMRKGFPRLSLMVQEALKRDPMCGHLFVFRGRGGGLIKVIWHRRALVCHKEAGARTPHLAISSGWHGGDHAFPSGFSEGNRILQFGNIDSNKSFSIICHGSSSCEEDRLGLSEQPSEDHCRASHLSHEDGHTVLRERCPNRTLTTFL